MKLHSSVAILSLTLLLGGCIVAPGHPDGGRIEPTVGQQLIDLDRARDQGILTPEEYALGRQQILDRMR
jgi:hypothetical protein